MKYRSGAVLGLCIAAATASQMASAATLPAIKASDRNPVAACATPGRLVAYLKSRNATLDRRFETIATEYMRHGEQLGVRWDYAFFQMLVETASLSFKRGNGQPGDVKANQNNFAGLGATGGGEPGERFPDVATGVKAHLQHALLYAGEKVDSPVAERTRKVQEWGILTSWQKGFNRPITFTDMTRKWSPKDNGYSNDIESVATKFFADFCNKPDPQPELVQEARRGRTGIAVAAATSAPVPAAKAEDGERVSGAELARKAVEQARKDGNSSRFNLGAKALAAHAGSTVPAEAAPAATTPAGTASAAPAFTILNALAGDAPAPSASAPAPAGTASVQTASAATTARPAMPSAPAASPAMTPPAPPASSKCKVWTASYGGQKSVLIRQVTDQSVNYTVLVVNDGSEKREVEAYVSAYAKGGQSLGEFASQTQALDKAFDLCPES